MEMPQVIKELVQEAENEKVFIRVQGELSEESFDELINNIKIYFGVKSMYSIYIDRYNREFEFKVDGTTILTGIVKYRGEKNGFGKNVYVYDEIVIYPCDTSYNELSPSDQIALSFVGCRWDD